VLANSQKGLQQVMDNLNKVTREICRKINVQKTKVMQCFFSINENENEIIR